MVWVVYSLEICEHVLWRKTTRLRYLSQLIQERR